jgi:DNA-binding MarR family transcriptional regulator
MQDNLSPRQVSRNPTSAGRPTGRVGQLLFVAQQAAQALATGRLEPLGLSPRGWGVLSTLVESGPLTQIELATTMSIDRTAMVYLIDELEEHGLVERVRHPQDRRAFLIHLTGSGQDTQRRAAAALDGATETLLTPLDSAERQQLVALLAKVAAHWQEAGAGSAQTRPAAAGPGEPGPSRRPRRTPASRPARNNPR